MAKYHVSLKEFGSTSVDAENRFGAVKAAAKKLAPNMPLAFLFTIASVTKTGARAGRPPKFPW